MSFRVLLLGGYGNFGRRIASTLARDPQFDLVIAGRNAGRAQTAAAELDAGSIGAALRGVGLDLDERDFGSLIKNIAPDLVIHTCGPFQRRDYSVAHASLAAGAHYLDLADARDFVCGITALDTAARAAGRLVISGASTVPALSAAVIDRYAGEFRRLTRIDIGISPGNRTPRGAATVAAILSYVGKPIIAWKNGRPARSFGWQNLRRQKYPAPVGARWLATCEVPDLTLLPGLYPELDTVEFRAGLELRRMHFGLWLLSFAVRVGLIERLDAYSTPLLKLSERWQQLGSTAGAMHVELDGERNDGSRARLHWTLLAESGDGPQVPCTAALVLARKLARGELRETGARPCLGLFTLEEFLLALQGFDIRTETRWSPLAQTSSSDPW